MEADPPRRAFHEACRRIRQVAPGDPPLPRLGAGAEPETVYWFRWVTGHQVSFVIWRLMAWLLDDLRAGRVARPAAVRSLTEYVRGYSAMLDYGSSCPREVYQSVIRPSMYRQHRGFSGSWAPDYRPVREVFRGTSWASCCAGSSRSPRISR
ncbi:hypothetical protein [Streptomyces sp. XD-27]|uniref:hypothetical protein n=1 Tax=Streptomyces sp. XD-27 TaxID=3062779 RepID=UPI0026F42012|nr:hypothetical protein [Streptomyces sp. XD-27]WKX68679.1 hypothetical protein Q3Y56_00860 [Streptomyces sp. XD-27]